jgi:hypothetical protein
MAGASGGGGDEKLGGIYFQIEGRTGDLHREFDKTQRQARQVDEELKRLKASVKAGEISYGEYAKRAQALADSKRRIQAESNRLRAALDAESATVQQASSATERYARQQGWLRDQHDATGRALGRAGNAAGSAGHKLQVFGQTLDDLQYVGEMGLRPIINNIMSISPTVGIALLAFMQLAKHGDELKELGKALGDYWAGGMDKATGATKGMIDAVQAGASALEKTGKFLAEVGEGWDAMTKKREKSQDARRKEFLEEGTPEQRKKGQSIAEAIDEYGHGRFLNETIRKRAKIDPELRNPTDPRYEDAFRRESDHLFDLLEDAKKGNESAIAGLIARTEGTGIGSAIEAKDPAFQEEVKAYKEQREEEEKLAAERDREAAERRKKAEKAFDDRAEDVAKAGQGRYLGAMLENQARGDTDPKKLTDEQFRTKQVEAIRKHLLDTGQAADEDEARKLGDAVAKKLEKGAWDAIRKRVNEEGITPEQASKELLGEHKAAEDAKERSKRQKADAEANADRREQEQARKLAVEEAERVMPGVDEKVRDAMIKGRFASGGDAEGTNRQLEKAVGEELVDQGMTAEDAARAAIEIVEKQSMKLSDDVVKRALKTDKAEAPQAMGASEILRKTQASVTKDVDRDQLDQLVRITKIGGRTNELLERMGNGRSRLGP